MGSEPMRARGIIVFVKSNRELVGSKNVETKHLLLVKAIVLVFKAGAFRY